MLLVTSIVIGALGALARFQAAPEVAEFKMHALGVSMMVFAVVGVLVAIGQKKLPHTLRVLAPPVSSS